MTDDLTPQQKMNSTYRRILNELREKAVREVTLARADGDRAALVKAQVRLETLKAATDIYAASHKVAYGTRPWTHEP